MARIPEIIRRNPISHVAARPGQSGQGFAALADMAGAAAEFISPMADKQATSDGQKSVYRDASGALQVDEKSEFGGRFAALHNSAAYAKYLSQKSIDISETMTELAVKHEFDPDGFKSATDSYLNLLKEDENVPSVLKEDVLNNVRQEAHKRFNGLYQAGVDRTYKDADRNTKAARDMLVDDYVSLFVGGDLEGAEQKMKEIEEMSRFRANAPYITETKVQTEQYLRGVRGSAKAGRLIRDLTDLDGASEIDGAQRTEIEGVLKDPDIDPATRQKLYTATQGRLKGIDANALIIGMTDTSFDAMYRRHKGNSPLSEFAVEGATRKDSFSGMGDNFRSSLETMFDAAPPEIKADLKIGSGYRSNKRQSELWAQALKKYGSPEEARKWVAPPGSSQHNHGNAADLKFGSDAARKWVHENAGSFGLNFPLANEDWHIEMSGARDGNHEKKRGENQKILTDAGLPVNDANEFMALEFGIEKTVAMLSADPASPASEFISASMIEANPELGSMTIRDAQNWAARKMTMKASDLGALVGRVNQIEDSELRGMAMARLGREIQTRQAIENAAEATYRERLASDDDTLTNQEIVEDQDLSSGDQLILSNALENVRKKQTELQNTAANLVRDGFAWDIYDSGQRKDVDEYYQARIGDDGPMSTEQNMALGADMTRNAGFVPKSLGNAILMGMKSNDPTVVATAMEYAAGLESRTTTAFNAHGKRAEIRNGLTDYKGFAQFHEGPVAAQMVIDARENIPKNVTDLAKRMAEKLDIGDLADHLGASTFADPTDVNVEAAVMNEYTQEFITHFQETGDFDRSVARAQDHMGRIYGANTITGNGRGMRLPPNKTNGEVNGSQDWMGEQIEQKVSAHVFGDDALAIDSSLLGKIINEPASWVRARQIKLVSDHITDAEFKTGKPASYNVWYTVNGLTDLLPERFSFNPTKWQEKRNAELSAGQDVDLLRQQFRIDIENLGIDRAKEMYLERLERGQQ